MLAPALSLLVVLMAAADPSTAKDPTVKKNDDDTKCLVESDTKKGYVAVPTGDKAVCEVPARPLDGTYSDTGSIFCGKNVAEYRRESFAVEFRIANKRNYEFTGDCWLRIPRASQDGEGKNEGKSRQENEKGGSSSRGPKAAK